MPKLSIRDLDLDGKRVFVRVDFNVPLSDSGEITDDTRIRQTLPTLEYALGRGARLILASHLGRPKGKPNPKMSLAPVVVRLGKLLNRPVIFASDCIGPAAEKPAGELRNGELLLLENLRYHPEEEANDPEFSRQLARLGELYVNDAFGSAHRAHASTAGMTRFFPKAAAGLLMEKELNYLTKATSNPERPFVSLLGGAKVSDKIEVIQNLLPIVDNLLIGGAMAYTFLRALGLPVGKSLVEEEKVELARRVLVEAKQRKYRMQLPVDHVIAQKLDAGAPTRVVDGVSTPIPDDFLGVDIGPETVQLYTDEIAKAKTVIWNGPMGVFEMEPFAQGTLAIARALASFGGTSIVGGGDSIAALARAGVEDKITHVCTGGGASLEFLAGEKLPGIEALTDIP
ncbi:MAG: phosphoglycerate kinase [Acidobacteria bacterium RIFCSPLOWO2_12_FULL_60_22]|nr:MAG: phosphoglycerate kinase [Acidobacteria bacterium RIFCSPLOWO2_12_FULL_60_22]